MTSEERRAHARFVRALQGEPLTCPTADCPGPVEAQDASQPGHRVKTFAIRCLACGKEDRLRGKEDPEPPWDEASLLEMANEHLMHQQPACPNDASPVVFTSLPNPRRRARYRISCFFCGRQADIDWPPPEARR